MIMKNKYLLYSLTFTLALCLTALGQINSGLVKKELSDADLFSLMQQSDLVISIRVQKVDASPMRWSGFVSSIQTVHYKIDHLFKGELNSKDLDIAFLLDESSPMVEANNPKLSKLYFDIGHKHLIFIKFATKRYCDIPKDETKSLLQLSPDDYLEVIVDENSVDHTEKIIQTREMGSEKWGLTCNFRGDVRKMGSWS